MSSEDGERVPLIEKKLSFRTKSAYALGHVFNDLAAAMWFSYTLIFLQRVTLLAPLAAGAMLLLGQLVDALMTPISGVLVDRYSKKKIWHIVGSTLVAVSFPVIFGSFSQQESSMTTFLLISSITIFQAGWALVQISHLSMIPYLSKTPLVRAELTAIRYSAQVGSAIIVFLVTWIVLPNDGASVERLGPEDDYKFRNIVIVLTALGIFATILFHVFLKSNLLEETSQMKPLLESSDSKIHDSPKRLKRSWMGTELLLRVALLYVSSRLFITLATVYLPLYIEEADVGGKQALATVPLASYLSSFAAALLLKYINRSCGTKVCYLIGGLIGIVAAIVTEFAGSSEAVIYIVAVLIGAGSSITMVTALSVTADLIGPRTESSAWVYSIVTFFDKIVTGLVVIFIERWRCHEKEACPNYNRHTLSLVCASSMLLGLITLMTIARS